MIETFKLCIGSQFADFIQPMSLAELQTYDIVIDPNRDIDPHLFLDDHEIPLGEVEKIWKREKPGYKFAVKYKFVDIGIQSIRIEIDGRSVVQRIRIQPVKISQAEYETMLSQIQDVAYNIIFRVFGKTEEEIRLRKVDAPKSPIEYFYFFQKNFAEFKKIFQRIAKDPNAAIKERKKERGFFETEEFEEVVDYENPGKIFLPLQIRLKGLLPKTVTTSENFLSYDVYENRLLKHYIGMIVNKLCFLEEVALIEKTRESENQAILGGDPYVDSKFLDRIKQWQLMIEKCNMYKRDANRMRTSPFLEEVSTVCLMKTSMVLQKESRYKAFYKLYQDFRKNSLIEMQSDYFHLPVTDIWKTYEIWVLLRLYEVLRKNGFAMRRQGLANVDARFMYDAKKVRFNFSLVKNKSLLEMQKGAKIAKVYYQRKYLPEFEEYGAAYEKEQVPDMVVEIFDKGTTIPEIIILDPKYRIEGDRPPESAMQELSHYQNRIKDKHDRRIVKKAYIVYPGKYTKSFGKQGDFGYIGLRPSSEIKQFEQKILQLVS